MTNAKRELEKVIENRQRQRRYKERNPWVRHYYHIKTRCNHPCHSKYKFYGGKGIKCLISLSEIKKLWLRDKAYLMQKPSINRRNPDNHYTFDNCQFIEFQDNRKLFRPKKRRIAQYSLSGIFIRNWNSCREASKYFNVDERNINNTLRGRQKTSGGFIWKYY